MVEPINNMKECCTELEITPNSAAKNKPVLAGKPVEPAKIESKKDLQEYSYIPSAKKVLGVSLLLTAAAGSYYLYTQHPDQVENLNSRFSTLTNKISSQVSNQVSAASKQLTSLNTLASRKLSATGSLVQSAVTSFLAYSSQTYNSFVESVVSPTVVKQPEANQPEANQTAVSPTVANPTAVSPTVANPTAVSPTVVKQPEANQPVVNQTVVEQPEANQPVVSPTVNVKATVIDRNGIETRKNLSGKRTNEIMKTQEGTKKVRVIHISHRSKPPIKLTKNSSEANLKPSLVGQLMTNLFDLNKFLVIQTSSIIRSTPSYLTYLKKSGISSAGKLMNNMSYAREQGLGAAKYTWDYISPMATKVANVTVPCLIPLKKVAVSKAGELMNVTSYAGEQAWGAVKYTGSSISYLPSSLLSGSNWVINKINEWDFFKEKSEELVPKNTITGTYVDKKTGETVVREWSFFKEQPTERPQGMVAADYVDTATGERGIIYLPKPNKK